MFNLDFYPHECFVSRNSGTFDEEGKPQTEAVYSGKCYLTSGTIKVSGDFLQGEPKLMIPTIDEIFKVGDSAEVTFENDSIYSGTVRSSYPMKDDDIGGQELGLSHGAQS